MRFVLKKKHIFSCTEQNPTWARLTGSAASIWTKTSNDPVAESSNQFFCVLVFSGLARDCHDLFVRGQRASGVYTIQPEGSRPFSVLCEMTSGEWGRNFPLGPRVIIIKQHCWKRSKGTCYPKLSQQLKSLSPGVGYQHWCGDQSEHRT